MHRIVANISNPSSLLKNVNKNHTFDNSCTRIAAKVLRYLFLKKNQKHDISRLLNSDRVLGYNEFASGQFSEISLQETKKRFQFKSHQEQAVVAELVKDVFRNYSLVANCALRTDKNIIDNTGESRWFPVQRSDSQSDTKQNENRNHTVKEWQRIVEWSAFAGNSEFCKDSDYLEKSSESDEQVQLLDLLSQSDFTKLSSLPPAIAIELQRTCPDAMDFAHYIRRKYQGPPVSLRANVPIEESDLYFNTLEKLQQRRLHIASRLKKELELRYQNKDRISDNSNFCETKQADHQDYFQNEKIDIKQKSYVNGSDTIRENYPSDMNETQLWQQSQNNDTNSNYISLTSQSNKESSQSLANVFLQRDTVSGIRVYAHQIEKFQSYRDGFIDVQDESSIRFIERLTNQFIIPKMIRYRQCKGSIQPFRILDYCAGKGGKALGLASLFKNFENVVIDVNDVKASFILELIKRAKQQNVEKKIGRIYLCDQIWSDSESSHKCIGSAQSEQQSSEHESLENDNASQSSQTIAFHAATGTETSTIPYDRYDLVIVDAPCSNLGRIMRQPGVRVELEKRDFSVLNTKQSTILNNAAKYVRRGLTKSESYDRYDLNTKSNINERQSGGILAYATCSLLESCNQNVNLSSETENDFEFSEEKTLWPHIEKTDGFYWKIWYRK